MAISKCAILFVILSVCVSCSESSPGNGTAADTSPDSSTNNVNIDTILQSDTSVNSERELPVLRVVRDWKISDFIVTENFKSSESVKRTVEWELEEWKNVKSPFVATYTGCDMGDYFHLIFQDSTGKEYDFGFGNNRYGEYTLFDKDLIDNPKYVGKSFVIYWNWEISSFPCCDGEYDLVEAYMPSIVRLELREMKAQ